MRNIEEISKRAVQMHAFVQHGEYVLKAFPMPKQQRRESEVLLNQMSAEIDLLRWVLGLEEETWFDQIDKPDCVEHI
jgi:hypothetical protein